MAWGNSTRRNYSLVAWNIVCKSKDQGGLCILDLKLMNKALLAKWWIRFLDNSVIGRWKSIIISKYGHRTAPAICSPFWKSILKDHKVINLGLNNEIGNDKSTSFWLDRWYNEHALQHQFPNLFSIVSDRFLSVADVFASSRLHMTFQRQLTGIYRIDRKSVV